MLVSVFYHMGLLDGFRTLKNNINKAREIFENEEGVVGSELSELTLTMGDDALIELSNKWENDWKNYDKRKKLEEAQKENEKYWLGEHYGEEIEGEHQLKDNLIFAALETFLPIATRQNPEPVVNGGKREEGIKFSKLLRDIILDVADVERIRLKLKKSVRYWALYLLGAIKIAWDPMEDRIVVHTVRPQKLILDPNGVIEEGLYTGEYIGEVKQERASDLIIKFKDKKAFIEKYVNDKMGTKVRYVEWWTNEYVFWRLGGEVLGKAKNPHFNYEGEEVSSTDEFGNIAKTIKQPINLFTSPRLPYAFLSVFNLGISPFDETSLIGQNIPLQDMVNKRLRQVDKNVDRMNSGAVVSGDYYTQDQAQAVVDAVDNGGVVWQPTGSVRDGFMRDTGPSLPADVYTNLNDARNELLSIFGVKGSTAQGISSEDTVRGKIIIRSQDSDRIGGGISEHIEQLADHVYNYIAQMALVYYAEANLVDILGEEDARAFSELKENVMSRKRVTISVKEGSLIPHDELTTRNEAIDLWSAGVLDPLSFFERLDDADPKERVKRLMLWKTDPFAYASETGIQRTQQTQEEQVANQINAQMNAITGS